MPVGWIVVGDPARILPPDQRDAIREIKKPLNLPLAVYGRARLLLRKCRVAPTHLVHHRVTLSG